MTNDERIYRVIDANLNRLKEGLRVVEDIKRYVFDDAEVAYKIKSLRHKAKIPQKEFLKFRNLVFCNKLSIFKTTSLKPALKASKKDQIWTRSSLQISSVRRRALACLKSALSL